MVRRKSFFAADNLILAVENAISVICANPYQYRNTYKNLREITIKKYPFNLIYFVDEDKKLIKVISLFHHRRNPKIKYKKVSRKRK
ncbi:MAG: type II toxin-antitoxin system RelE/ParE family toxin [Ginsengibacter sp.]